MKTTPIAVVGGGPAGSTCARALAAAGAVVDLFESRPADEKPCGGGVPSAALREFPDLALPSLRRRIVREVIIYSPSDRRVRVPLRDGIHVFSRRELDACLRDKAVAAGAALRATRVGGVRRARGRVWELATDQGAAGPYDRLVAADGVRGVVRRSLAGPFRQDHLTLALYAYVPGVRLDAMILKFYAGLHGYLWVFPRDDHVSVGICAAHGSAEVARLEDELHRFVDAHCPQAAFAPSALKGYFIPASPCPAGPSRGDGWALAGDAAGFVDPLTREGIAWAMRSGSDVARGMILQGRLRTPDLPENLRWAHRYGPGFYREDFLENMARVASASSAIRKVLADLFTGHQGYRWLKARLVLNALPCGWQIGMQALAGLVRR